ncbi:MAG: tetratricopeptide repeat protein [candidate division NC10 bacterium]
MVGVLSACATTQSLQQVAQVNQDEASRLEGAGRLRDALERWKIIMTIDPQHPGASQKKTEIEAKIKEQSNRHVAAGKELLQRREKQGAQRELLAALRLDPLNREALEQLYQSEQQLGEQTAFARPLRRSGIQAKSEPSQGGDAKSAPAEEPEEDEESGEEVSFAEAAELFRSGDYLAAIDAFGRVLAQEPGLREAVEYQKLAYYNQGVAYIAKQSYAEALKMFERLRRIQPDFKRLSHYMQTAREKLADQHHLAGIRHFKEQKLKEAIEEWDQALALNPKLESARRSQERARRLLKSLQEIK